MDIANRLANVLAGVAEILYLKREEGEHPHIAITFTNKKEIHREYFATDAECNEAWKVLEEMLTKNCSCPFINLLENVLLQPVHLIQLARYANEQAYFVVLIFIGEHNLALGYKNMQEQNESYRTILQALGEEPDKKSGVQLIH